MSDVDELLAHLVGDYLVQSDWMATEKTKRWWPAAVHAASYAACFLPVTRNWRALAVIGVTHAVIDRTRPMARFAWAKNQVAPAGHRPPWGTKDDADMLTEYAYLAGVGQAEWDAVAKARLAVVNTGYAHDRPVWLTTWLNIIADNTVHLLINRAALRWLR